MTPTYAGVREDCANTRELFAAEIAQRGRGPKKALPIFMGKP